MTTLPRALIFAHPGLPFPADRRGLLVPPGCLGDPDLAGAFVLAERDIGVAFLRKALTNGAAGFALASCRAGADVQRLAILLAVAEAESGRAEGSTPILALTDGILPPDAMAGATPRLAGLVWDQQGLAKRLGARRAVTASGDWTPAFAGARTAVLFAAAAAGVAAYDGLTADAGDAFADACALSRDDGFFGRIASDTAQKPVIEAVYGLSPENLG